MNREQRLVRDFHRALDIPAPSHPEVPLSDRRKLRLDLIMEELEELADASGFKPHVTPVFETYWTDHFNDIPAPDIVKAADALGDLLVVVYGAALEWGIDLEAIFNEIHKTNCLKAGGPVREDGKVLKPEGWQPPDLEPIIRHQVAFGHASESSNSTYPDEWDSDPHSEDELRQRLRKLMSTWTPINPHQYRQTTPARERI